MGATARIHKKVHYNISSKIQRLLNCFTKKESKNSFQFSTKPMIKFSKVKMLSLGTEQDQEKPLHFLYQSSKDLEQIKFLGILKGQSF